MNTAENNFGQSNIAKGVLDDSKVASRLIQKNFSPLTIRKFQIKGWPAWVGLICDYSLEDLDLLIHNLLDECEEFGYFNNNLQNLRNAVGYINEKIAEHYNNKKRGCAEGVIVTLIADKCQFQSAMGDFMNHNKCLQEYMFLLNMAPHI